MKGLYKYLVGGLVGAVFGFLVAPKRAQKVRDALLGHESTPALPEQLLRSLPPAMFTPPAAATEDSLAVPEAQAPVDAPLVAKAAPEPEQLSGATAWEAAAHDEAEALPSTCLPEEAGLMEGIEPASQPLPWPEVDQADTALPGEIQDVAASFVPGVLEPEPISEAAIEVELEPAPLSEAAADAEVTAELVTVEEPAAPEEEPVPLPEPEVEPVLESEVEPVLESEAAADLEPAATLAEEVAPQPAVETDLRARIEETRRRIREEIERPFRVTELADEEPAPAQTAPPSLDEAPEPGLPELTIPVAAAPVTPEQPVTQAPTPSVEQGAFDYEAMRRRIEETRSRLKAKAFDAMMSGETALLAQTQGSEGGQEGAVPVTLDEDVDQSIETGLSVEDA